MENVVKFVKVKDTNQLPKTSGVYLFYEKSKIIYIGKAIDIKNRVKNHFQQPTYRDNLFISRVSKIGYIETGSEIEALVLEASLIKKRQPKFNVIWKDDKNYFYVAITKEERPVIYITHQKTAKAEYIGPFVEGTALKKTLRFLRRAFPFYTSSRHPKNNCTYCHLGLCPGPNPDLKEYKKNIKKLSLILKGKRKMAFSSLRKEMKKLSKERKFEEAAKVRDRISNLNQVMSHTRVIEFERLETKKNKTDKILQAIVDSKEEIKRIEAYDISNIQGQFATGSMVVFKNNRPDKDSYRKFKIQILKTPNDIAMLKETLERRFSHKEWPLPEVILIDGGKAQLNIAISVKDIDMRTRSIKVISIAKRNNELYIEGRKDPILLKNLPQDISNLILNLDSEAHRFAITYHKKLRKKDLLQ